MAGAQALRVRLVYRSARIGFVLLAFVALTTGHKNSAFTEQRGGNDIQALQRVGQEVIHLLKMDLGLAHDVAHHPSCSGGSKANVFFHL